MKKLITLLLVFMLTSTVNIFANTYVDEDGTERLSYTIEPVGGEVTEISEIIVSFSMGCMYSSFNPTTTGIFDSNGVNLIVDPNNEFTRSDNNTKFHFKPTNGTITTPGTYTFKMPAAAVSTGFSSISGTQNGAIEIVYTVVAPPLVPGEAVTPAVGSTVMDLSTITIPFAEPAEVVGNLADVTLGGQAVNAVTMSPDGLTATITSSATFNEGNVTLSIPKGFFKAQNSPSVNDALSYSWNVVKASLGITAPEFIFKGDVANVTLELTNGILFAGFQLDMVLPEGLTVEEITGAPCDFVLSRDNGHIINDGVVDGKIRLLSYGEEAQEYTGNAGTLVTFAVKANDTFEGGNIAISNIKFADREGVKYLLADVASEEIDSRTYVASITIAPTELNLETNETATVEAAVLPEAAFNKTYVWSSSNTDYVTVDENGVVTAVKPTEAENPVYIIATAQDGSNVKAQIPVTVVFTHAANIEVAPNYVNIEAGQTAQLEAVIKDANGAEVATNKTVVWESSNEEVATVDETGLVTLVTAHIVGEAVITATIQGTEISATATVEVKATLAQNITVSPTDIQLETGGTWTLIANVDKNATNRAVVWSVVEGSEDYVSIDAAGEVTALAITPEGTPAQVKATTADGTNLSATANVTVVATLATSVTVEKVDEEASTNLKHTESIELRAVLEGETNKNIVWTADPAEYVDIDVETGIATVTANATVGAVTVYATVENTNVQGFIELNIVKTPVETIAINYDTENQPVKFETGAESFELTATVGPDLATDKTYAWSTTDADIAYVDENNQVVFGQKTGEVTLTATANDDAEVYDTLTFNVVYTLAGEIVIASDSADNTLKAGESLTLTATADTNKEIRWSADPEDCVEITVDPETGAATVTALKYVEGGVTIKAQIFEGETPVVTAEQKITLEITRGDVNNDAIVNILDVTVTAAYILGQEVNTFIFAAADLDNDQVIDIADIVRLVKLILSQPAETPEQQAIINRARRFADSSNSLSIEDFEINEGETKQIAIKLDNSKAFSAFQADIYLPEGLEFVDGALSARQSADHVMASTVREDGSVRMLSYSMDLDTYSGSEGDFIYLTVKAEEGFVGDFQIEIDNIVFVQADQSASYFQPVVANVNGVETTGIEDVEGDEFEVKVVGNTIVAPEGAEVYDLNGLRVNAENLAKGIYIVKVGNQIVKVII